MNSTLAISVAILSVWALAAAVPQECPDDFKTALENEKKECGNNKSNAGGARPSIASFQAQSIVGGDYITRKVRSLFPSRGQNGPQMPGVLSGRPAGTRNNNLKCAVEKLKTDPYAVAVTDECTEKKGPDANERQIERCVLRTIRRQCRQRRGSFGQGQRFGVRGYNQE